MTGQTRIIARIVFREEGAICELQINNNLVQLVRFLIVLLKRQRETTTSFYIIEGLRGKVG